MGEDPAAHCSQKLLADVGRDDAVRIADEAAEEGQPEIRRCNRREHGEVAGLQHVIDEQSVKRNRGGFQQWGEQERRQHWRQPSAQRTQVRPEGTPDVLQ